MIHVVTFILDRSDLPGSSANLTRALALNLQTPTTSPAFTAVWNQLAPLHPSDADSDAEVLVEDTDTPNRIQQLENELSTKQVQLIKTKRDESRLSRGLVQLIGRARNQEARDAQAQDSLAQEHQAQVAALQHELAAERSKTTKVREDRRIAQEARRIAEEKARELEAQNAALQDSVQAERHRHQIERDHHLAQWEADRQANNDQRIKAIEADYTQRLEQKEAELALARDAVAAAEQAVLEADQTQASIEAERLKQLEAQHLLKTEAQAAEKEQRRRARKEKEAAHKRKHNELINAIPVQEEDVSQTAKELQQAKLDGQIRAENQEILILVTRTMKQHFLGNQDERVVLAEIKGRLDEVGRMFEQGANLQDAVASGGAVFNKLSDIQVDEISTSTVRRQVPGAILYYFIKTYVRLERESLSTLKKRMAPLGIHIKVNQWQMMVELGSLAYQFNQVWQWTVFITTYRHKAAVLRRLMEAVRQSNSVEELKNRLLQPHVVISESVFAQLRGAWAAGDSPVPVMTAPLDALREAPKRRKLDEVRAVNRQYITLSDSDEDEAEASTETSSE